MKRRPIRFPGFFRRKYKPLTDEEIATRYEAIIDPVNLPPPEEVTALCMSTDARTRILSHAEALKPLHPHSLSPKGN